ncbi:MULTISPECIES: HpcH/HpaI aldolase family protein [unclassified Paenibacillus]|uniref:HpcH/HpaI aldolase family protein n=1 Tax=unclassified Paenibacillus TaxID=185978 RepID=UPI003624CC7B
MHKLKEVLAGGQTAYGIFSALKDPAVIEILGYVGYDYVVIDLEHTALDLQMMEHMIRAARIANISSIVRTPQDDYGSILRAVESGADAVMIPHLVSKQQGEKIVGMAKYQPIGHRGIDGSTRVARYGGVLITEHMKQENERVLVIGMIEDVEAVENIDEIITVQGLDLLFIGPSDLAGSFGLPGQVTHPEVRQAIQVVMDKSNKAGIKVGIPAFRPSELKEVLGMGASFVTTPAVDASHLTQSLKAHLKSVKNI